MNKPTFTKGPWASEDNRDGVTEFYPKDRYPCVQPIASCYAKDISEHAKGENKANARLIAAAPELFKVLQAAEQMIGGGKDYVGENGNDPKMFIPHMIREILAKVEGEK